MSGVLSASAFVPAALPDVLPIFPLAGAVLLPRAQLPLHIFEPRYLAMIDDVLASRTRMVGMIQPLGGEETSGNVTSPAVYSVGCAGRITSFAETGDGRLMLNLTGICRFEIYEELRMPMPYRQVRPKWDRFIGDIDQPAEATIDHDKLSVLLQPYLKAQNIEADYAAIEGMDDETLISTLTMICPLAPNEKQALLEAPDLARRAELLMALLAMASLPPADGHAKH